MEVRLLSVGARGFFLASSRLAFTASPLNSVISNEKKTSGTQGKCHVRQHSDSRFLYYGVTISEWDSTVVHCKATVADERHLKSESCCSNHQATTTNTKALDGVTINDMIIPEKLFFSVICLFVQAGQ